MGREKSIISRLPAFYRSGDTLNLLYRLIAVYGALLDEGDIDLVSVMRSHYVNSADNIDSKGFNTSLKGDLDKIFSLYIENLGGTSLLKQGKRRDGELGLTDDEVYRNRIKGLINVLRKGASHKDGIIKIIAANLGITGEGPEQEAALQQIQVLEFTPRPFTTRPVNLRLFEPFKVINPNRLETELTAITIEFRDDILETLQLPFLAPRLVNLTTEEAVQYQKSLLPGNELTIFPGREHLLGRVVEIEGTMPRLPSVESFWQIEAGIGLPQAEFDTTAFDFSLFEESEISQFSFFGQSNFDESVFVPDAPLASVAFSFIRLRPASFRVNIDWDIPGFTTDILLTDQSLNGLEARGFSQAILEALSNLKDTAFKTKRAFRAAVEAAVPSDLFFPELIETILSQAAFPDKFAELDVNPRNQIKFIVDKVKAAGVSTELAYRKKFVEAHNQAEVFRPQVNLVETQELQENLTFNNSGSPFPGEETHEMTDGLITSGLFDLTTFDSLNGFT